MCIAFLSAFSLETWLSLAVSLASLVATLVVGRRELKKRGSLTWSSLPLLLRLFLLGIPVALAAAVTFKLTDSSDDPVPTDTFSQVCSLTPKLRRGDCWDSSDGDRLCKFKIAVYNNSSATQSADSLDYVVGLAGIDLSFNPIDEGGQAFEQIGPLDTKRGWVLFRLSPAPRVGSYRLLISDPENGVTKEFIAPITPSPAAPREGGGSGSSTPSDAQHQTPPGQGPSEVTSGEINWKQRPTDRRGGARP